MPDWPTRRHGWIRRPAAAHATISDACGTCDQVTLAGRRHATAAFALADQPELDAAVLAALDRPAHAPRGSSGSCEPGQFLQARSAANTSEPPTELAGVDDRPTRRSTPCSLHYAEAEALHRDPLVLAGGVPPAGDPHGRIRRVVSGAVGPMQFLPTTWAECCTGDPLVTRDAIIGAATYLAQSGGPADMNAAVYQYNPNDRVRRRRHRLHGSTTRRQEPGLYHVWRPRCSSAARPRHRAAAARVHAVHTRSTPLPTSLRTSRAALTTTGDSPEECQRRPRGHLGGLR